MTSEAPRLHGPLALQPLHPHWGVPITHGVAQGRVLAHPLSWSPAGGATQEPDECAHECATGRHVRAYVRLNDLNPQEREQHAADKLAKKARDLKDRRAANFKAAHSWATSGLFLCR